ncbi:hypothetical protein PanWU01x14_041420 [Parasponia andersonii]|uniref:Uncharacterized protein n=1 Tax=Parasponia andersonii TaxID=3476 RepID=A0A2P5DQF6_PARAD|nr:hypothetical protein PanWU01x14_041420 [Parasponia andersonii]
MFSHATSDKQCRQHLTGENQQQHGTQSFPSLNSEERFAIIELQI